MLLKAPDVKAEDSIIVTALAAEGGEAPLYQIAIRCHLDVIGLLAAVSRLRESNVELHIDDGYLHRNDPNEWDSKAFG